MTDSDHYRRLERLYQSAPVTRWFGTSIRVTQGAAEVRLEARPQFHHAAHASGRLFLAEAQLFDAAQQLLGEGSGMFTRSGIALDTSVGYV